MQAGVVRLAYSGEALKRNYPIEWAEIVAYDVKQGANLDWKYRSEGRMAIRLLTKGDCFGACETSFKLS